MAHGKKARVQGRKRQLIADSSWLMAKAETKK